MIGMKFLYVGFLNVKSFVVKQSRLNISLLEFQTGINITESVHRTVITMQPFTLVF
jgi:hypothetical protein